MSASADTTVVVDPTVTSTVSISTPPAIVNSDKPLYLEVWRGKGNRLCFMLGTGGFSSSCGKPGPTMHVCLWI
jgi:hypothetical protein